MRVLVTGGCGFIGSHFVRRLVVGGDDVVVLDKLTYAGSRARLDGVEYAFLHGDIADSSMVRRAAEGCDAVVNFAAETHVDRSILDAASFIQTDVVGAHVLLESARAAGTRFIQVSTDEVYGDVPPAASADENDPLRPSNPYSASKAAADLQVLAYVRTYEVDASITRGGNTYGPYQHPEKLIPLFVTNALTGLPLPLYGDGGQRRQWLHVEDHCAAIDLVLRRGERGAVYNIGGEERDNVSITELILRLTDADASLVRHVSDRPGHDRRYSVDSTRIRALGWAPRARFEDGIAATVAWYRERRDWWEPIKSGEYANYYEAQYAERLRGAHRTEGDELGVDS
jgi:dTDP-glucose 4,6-dehydratase